MRMRLEVFDVVKGRVVDRAEFDATEDEAVALCRVLNYAAWPSNFECYVTPAVVPVGVLPGDPGPVVVEAKP